MCLKSLEHEPVAVGQRLRVDSLEVRMMRILEIHDYPVTGPIADYEVYGPCGLGARGFPVVGKQNVVAVSRVLPYITSGGTGEQPEDLHLVWPATAFQDRTRFRHGRLAQPGVVNQFS